MGDLRRIADSLRETIRHANHGRIEYPWQKAQQDASAAKAADELTSTGPRLDSLDRPARPDAVAAPKKTDEAFAETDNIAATPNLKGAQRDSNELATVTTAPVGRINHPDNVTTNPVVARGSEPVIEDETSQLIKMEADDNHELVAVRRPEVEDETGLLIKMEADDNDVMSSVRRPDLRDVQSAPQRIRAAPLPHALPTGPMPTDYQETRPAPRFDEDEIVELKPRDVTETDPRMRRSTNPLEERKSSPRSPSSRPRRSAPSTQRRSRPAAKNHRRARPPTRFLAPPPRRPIRRACCRPRRWIYDRPPRARRHHHRRAPRHRCTMSTRMYRLLASAPRHCRRSAHRRSHRRRSAADRRCRRFLPSTVPPSDMLRPPAR